MTAQSIGIFTIQFPDPYAINYYNDQFSTLAVRANDVVRITSQFPDFNRLQQNVSFQYPITSNIQTLSPKSNSGRDPYGILYVPDLRSNECKGDEPDHVPANVTRYVDLPQDTEYALIAVAPWFSPACIQEYFDAARQLPVKAFVVYQPGTSNAQPPAMSDPSWNLNDGGSWKSANSFPTYAISSMSGGIVMNQLNLYSGNISQVPNGEELSRIFGPSDYIRLWATVNTESGNRLPSLWVFLVIVIGLLILVILATSFGMHMMQRRRRNSLRRRIINGEVDLEAIGVKRLTVPRHYLEKLPLYTYSGPSEDVEKTPKHPAQAYNIPSPTIHAETGMKTAPLSRRPSAPSATSSANTSIPSAFSQPTCPICLDDFEPNETQVRELPCRHIFHPDCIDTFLLSNSSLCPMCKKSVLPAGYCPDKITNIMVRRERMIRRMRARSHAGSSVTRPAPPTPPTQTSLPPGPPNAVGSLRSRVGGAFTGRRIFSAPERTQHRPQDIEMAGAAAGQTNVPPTVPAAQVPPPPTSQAQAGPRECPNAPTQNRREWARQRALALLGNRHAPVEEEEEEEEGTASRWRRGLRKVFPGFR